jgi:hypothetical protein
MNPRPTSVTVVGIIAIIMAVLCGCGYIGVASAPLMTTFQSKMFTFMIEEKQKTKRMRIATLEQQREEADEEDAAAIDQQIAQLQAKKSPDFQAFLDATMPRSLVITSVLVGILGLCIQGAFLVAGIKLFSMTPWARSLTINASIAAIVLVVAFNLYSIFFVYPETTAATQKFMAELEQMSSSGGTSQTPNMSGFMMITSTAGSIFNIAMHIAWPIVAIILLSSPKVKAAFQAAADARRFAPPQV